MSTLKPYLTEKGKQFLAEKQKTFTGVNSQPGEVYRGPAISPALSVQLKQNEPVPAANNQPSGVVPFNSPTLKNASVLRTSGVKPAQPKVSTREEQYFQTRKEFLDKQNANVKLADFSSIVNQVKKNGEASAQGANRRIRQATKYLTNDKAIQWNTDLSDDIEMMTEEQKNTFLYQVGKGNFEDAEKYLDYLERDLNAKRAAQDVATIKALSEDYGVAGKAASTFLGLAGGLASWGSAGDAAVQGVKNFAADKLGIGEWAPIDPNTDANTGARVAAASQESLSQEAYDAAKNATGSEAMANAAAFLTGTGLSIAQNVSNIAIFGPGSLYFMATSAGGQTVHESLQKGESLQAAMIKGSAAGVIEALTEKLPLDNLLKTVHTNPGNVKVLLKNVAKQSGMEFTEESISEFANLTVDFFVSKKNSDIAQMKQFYLEQGLSNTQANKQVAVAIAKQVALSGLGGALSGGVMGGGASAISALNAQQIGAKIRAQYTDHQLIAQALAGSETNSESFRMAKSFETRINRNGNAKISDFELGCLYVQMGVDAMSKTEQTKVKGKAQPNAKTQQRDADLVEMAQSEDAETAQYATAQLAHPEETVVSPISKKLMDSGMSAAVATEQAELIRKVSSGHVLSDAETKKLKLSNATVRAAFTEATGVEVKDISKPKQIIRSAAEVAQNKAKLEAALKEQEQARIAEQETTQPVQQAAEFDADRARAEDALVSILEGATKAEPSIKYANGSTMTRSEFVAQYLAAHPDATQENAIAAFNETALYHEMNQATPVSAVQTNKPANKQTRRSVSESKTAKSDKDNNVPNKKNAREIERDLTIQRLNALAKDLGVTFKYEDLGDTENGRIEGNTVYINSRKHSSQRAMTYYFVHEITHHAVDSDAAVTGKVTGKKTLTDDIIAVMKQMYGEDVVNDEVASKLKTYREYLSRIGEDASAFKEANAREEAAADFMMRAINNRALLDRLAGVKPSLMKTLIQRLSQLISRAKKQNVGTKELERLMDRMRVSMTEAASGAQKGAGDPAVRRSIDTVLEPLGLIYEKDENGVTIFRDAQGNVVDTVTSDMVRQSPLGAVINLGVESGVIQTEDADKQMDFFADLFNLMLETQDIDLIWAVSSSIGFNPIAPGARDMSNADTPKSSSRFSGYTSNSDPQYSTTVDFTTICLKTKAVIDAMSGTMVRLERGLTESEIIDIVYKNVHEAGEPVPCPVCYVFSRWVGLGGLFDTMWRNQQKYETADLETIRKDVARLESQIEKIHAKKGGKKNKATETLYKEMSNRFNELKTKETLSKTANGDPLTAAELKELNSLSSDLEILDNWSWLTNVRLAKNYKPVPAEVLFDINAGKQFAENYPESWKFRTTRGPAMGKAATPYAAEHLGQIIRGAGLGKDGLKKGLGDQTKNPFLASKDGTLNKTAKNAWTKSRAKVKAQNLLNGQRFQSTSDFRFEYALDYLLAFVEMQALGSKVQLYTKVPEAVRMFATVYAEVNCSLMPLGVGYDENGNLIFSSVTGMHADDAFRFSQEFDNVQPIMVGTSDRHIQLCMADDRITFIIPYHASGAGEARYESLMKIVGEQVEGRDDYSNYQTDHERPDATPAQKAARELRLKILIGKARTLSQSEADILRGNQVLHELYKRFYGKNADGNPEAIDQRYLSPSQRGANATQDNECFGVFLAKEQAGVVMPFEYWDRTSTRADADAQGKAFVEYCESLGLYPRFSGYDAKGVYHADKDFSQHPGYWKMLIDRRVYNNDGTYHEQKPIDVTKFDASFLLREESAKGITQPSLINDPAKVKGIVDKSVEEIEQRTKSGVRRSVGGFNPDLKYLPWEEQIDLWQDKKLNSVLRGTADLRSTLYVDSEPSALLQEIGLSDLPMVVTQSHVKKMLGKRWDENGRVIDEHSHELSVDLVKKLPELLRNPVAVFKSAPVKRTPDGKPGTYGGVMVMTSEVDGHGDPVFITVSPDKNRFIYDGVDGPAHFVNMYGLENTPSKLEDYFNEDRVLFLDKKKIDALPAELAAIFRRHVSEKGIDFDTIIAEKDKTVKLRNRKFSISDGYKEQQLQTILSSNPAHDDAHTWIRSADDIRTYEEAVAYDDATTPDFTEADMDRAMKTGKVKVYSSHPIEPGVFVSPSRMEAQSYAGAQKVYAQTVNLTDVAWIDGLQGQYAPVSDVRYSVGATSPDQYAPVFYSQMAKTLEGVKQDKLGASSVIPMLKGKGVKDDEIKWSGIEQFLSGKKSVTKQELLNFIRANELQVEEIELNSKPGDTRKDELLQLEFAEGALHDKAGDLLAKVFGVPVPHGMMPGEYNARQQMERILSIRSVGNPEFAQSPDVSALRDAFDQIEENTRKQKALREEINQDTPQWDRFVLPGGENYREILFRLPDSEYSNDAMETHWGNRVGILAHARVQDFVYDFSGWKTLFIEEIQSDWHNAGQKEGYRGSQRTVEAVQSEMALLDKETQQLIDSYGGPSAFYRGLSSDRELRAKYDPLIDKHERLLDEYQKISRGDYVPDAPFSKTYHEFVLKRLLRMAAEGGYDSLAWTTAIQQEDRWSSDYAEGYRIEYDQDIPKFLNKYGKKWGAKVEKSELPNGEIAWSMDITDEMKQSVLYEGQPRFSVSEDSVSDDEQAQNVLRSLRIKKLQSRSGYEPYAAYTPARIERELRLSRSPDDPNYAKSYITWVRPSAFVNATTTSADFREQLKTEAKPLDLEMLKDESQPIYLIVDFEEERVLGHEGRHRMLALQEAGIERVAVIIDSRHVSPYKAKPIERMYVSGQQWGYEEGDGFTLRNLLPLSDRYADAVRELFSGEEKDFNIRYSISPDTGYEEGSIQDRVLKLLRSGTVDDAVNLLQQWAADIEAGNVDAAEGETALRDAMLAKRPMTPALAAQKRAELDKLIKQYGSIPKGEKASRPAFLPKELADGRKVSKTARTVMEAKHTPDWFVAEVERAVADGDAGYTYNVATNQAAMDYIERRKRYGFEANLKEWERIVETGKGSGNLSGISKNDIALGEFLYTEAVKAGDVATATRLVAELAAVGTQAGQMVQAMSLLKRLTPSGQLYYLQKAVERLNRDAENQIARGKMREIVIDPTLAKAVLDAKTTDEMHAAMDALLQDIANQVPVTFADKWNTWRYFAMLGNPRTHIRNLASNVIFAPVVWAKDVVGAVVETGAQAVGIISAEDRTKSIGQAFAHLGYDLRIRNQYTKFADSDYAAMEDTLRGGGKYNPSDLIRDKRPIFRSAATKWVNTLSGLNSDLLEMEDAFFLKRAYVSALSQYLAAHKADVTTLENTPDGKNLLAKARVYAVQEAQKATFRDLSVLANALNKLQNSGTAGQIIVGGILPFKKTPINVLKRGVEYSPIGLLNTFTRGSVQLKQQKITAGEYINSLAAGMSGSAIMALGVYMAAHGLLRAGGGDDEYEKEFEELQGAQMYSLTIGDASYTIDWMAPAALPLFIGCELFGALSEDKEFTFADLADTMMLVAEPLFSLSMLDGLNTTLTTAGYSDNPLSAVAASVMTGYIGQAFPTLMGQLARSMDGTRRTTYVDKNSKTPAFVSRFVQSNVLAKTPVASETLTPRLDAWGRTDTASNKILGALENFLSPGYANRMKTSAMEEELERLYTVTGDKYVLPRSAAKYITTADGRKDLTSDEWVTYQTEMGQGAYEMLTRLVNTRSFQSLTDAQKAEAVKDVYTYADEKAKAAAVPSYATKTSWIGKADALAKQGLSVEDYIVQSVVGAETSGQNTLDVVQMDWLSDDDRALLISSAYGKSLTNGNSFTDPFRSGYQFTMTDTQTEQYLQHFDQLWSAEYAELISKSRYQRADANVKADMLDDLKSEVAATTKKWMARQLKRDGVKSTKKD